MAYAPIAGYALQTMTQQGEVAEGYYLKFYEANTTTPLSMATDATGSTLLAKAKLNDNGMPISNPLDNSTEFIPHMNAAYRLVIYLNETDADNNTTASALVNIANVRAPQGISVGVQDCTATFVSNVYTVTPTVSGFVALEEGLIIEFDLPSGSVTTGQAQINYNGTTDNLNWINGSATTPDDLNDTYTKRIKCRFDGTDWSILSNVSGTNINGEWERKADGIQICRRSVPHTTAISTASGSVFWNGVGLSGPSFPAAFSSTPVESKLLVSPALGTWLGGGNTATSTTKWSSYILFAETSKSSNTYTVNMTAIGRWY